MLSAFTAEPIIELKQRDKSKIEAIFAHGDQLFVGLSTGFLRIYRITRPPSRADDGSDVADDDQPTSTQTELLREYDKFSKHKIDQLAILREAKVLISLSGGLVSLHDLDTFELQEQLTRTKGASIFAVTSNIVNDVTTKVPTLVSKLAVAVKRRLLLWTWHDGDPSGEVQEVALASGIKSITWASVTTIVIGLQSSYVMLDIQSGETKPISGPGSIGGGSEQDSGRLGGIGTGTMSYIGMGSMIPPPLATGLGETDMLLARDINTLFIDRSGEPVNKRQVPWRSAPNAVAYSYPFLLSLQDPTRGRLEVRNPQTLTLLQSIELPGAGLLSVPPPSISLAHQGKGFLVASERVVWRMHGLSYDAQVDSLVESGWLDEAISLLGMIEDTLVRDKAKRTREIKMRKAQKLFVDKKYRDALEMFSVLLAPPKIVIAMYPEVISGDLAGEQQGTTTTKPAHSHKKSQSIASLTKEDRADTSSIRSVQTSSDQWTEKEMEAAVSELRAYLADIRRRLQRFLNPDQTVKSFSEVMTTTQPADQVEETKRLLQYVLDQSSPKDEGGSEKLIEVATLVDTTLFRAYMLVTPALAGSLFRIANFCDPEVVMSKLEETERYGDLIDFLYGKRLHRQALERLQKFGQAEKTERIDSQLHGPARTISYLQSLAPDLIDLVLEFARWPLEADANHAIEIFIADTENAEGLARPKVLAFLESVDRHLAQTYLEHVIDEWHDSSSELHSKLLMLYLQELKSESSSVDALLLSKFVTMLRTSSRYAPAKILSLLPQDDSRFSEATAIVYSKMGLHKQALQIYVFKLSDTAKAEEYCNQVYVEASTGEDSVSTAPRKSTVIDPAKEELSIYHVLLNLYLNPPDGEALIGPAIDLMAKHGPRLPANSTLDLIPNSLLVQQLEFYLRGRMRNAITATNNSKVAAGLRKVDSIRYQAALHLGEGDATLRPNQGRQRMVKVDDDRVCRVCHKRLGTSVITVFADNSIVHHGCANRRTMSGGIRS